MAMKTPGVYIVEKNAFPNSVVEVATAVPAFVGYTANAAIGVSWQIVVVVIVFISSLFTGMGVLVARFAGANEPEKVNRVVYQAFLTAVIMGVGVLAPVGYFASPALLNLVHAAPEVIAQARKVHDFLTVGAAAPLQHAVVTALNFPASYYDGLSAEYAASRDVLLGYLDQTGLSYTRPEGAYFVMLDISPFGYASDVEFAHWMAREIGVAPVPGSSFFANGENRYVRLNFAKRPATLHAAGERLLKLRR